MPLDSHFQTIVYDKSSGIIKAIFQGQYIKSRKALNLLLKIESSTGLNFFYFPGSYPLDISKHKVRLPAGGRAPRVVTMDGKDLDLVIAQFAGAAVLQAYNDIIIRFEGGTGDYIDQADVVAQLQREFTLKKFSVFASHASRIPALRMIGGLSGLEFYGKEKELGSHRAILDMAGINRFRGYAPFGKVGIYSAIAGLPSTAPRSVINFSVAEKSWGLDIIKEHSPVKKPFVIILHTVSGNSNTKSLPESMALRILDPLFENKKTVVLHLGGSGEPTIDHPRVISLQGKLSWSEVFCVMGAASACVCIDSAVMHIAQHLPLPTVSFWGPTDPAEILGDRPGIDVVRSTAVCRGCGLWNCKKVPCMTQFDLLEVAAAVSKLHDVKRG